VDGIIAAARRRTGAAVVIGNFDGVHVGHRILVARALADAEANGLRSVVLTFDRHPATVVRPASAPRLLTSVEEKLALLEATGVDEVVVLRFDAARAGESAEDFVRTVLVDELDARTVIVGASFRFGHGQGGDVALLARMGGELGFTVDRVELVVDDVGGGSSIVSSSRIRSLIASAHLSEAGELLGRPHSVAARVEVVDAGPRRLVASVPAELLVPPAGRYLGELAVGTEPARRDVRAVEIVVAARAGELTAPSPLLVAEVAEPSVLELDFAESGGQPSPIHAGDLVVVSFIAPARR